MYTLIFWIIGCVGLSCDIPGTETMYFDTMKDCESAEQSWRLSNGKNSGVCLVGTFKSVPDGIFRRKT